jgi:hypothetical protein
MKKVSLVGSLLVFCCLLNAASKDKFTIVSKNMIKNSDFSKGVDLPADWKLGLMANEVFNIKWVRPKNGRNYLSMESLGPDYSGYLTQKVKVKKDAWYRIKVRLSHSMGRGLIWIYGYDKNNKPVLFDRRKYLSSFVGNPLVPRFVRKELMSGTDNDSWRDVVFDFQAIGRNKQKSPEILRLSFGIYFTNAKIMFKKIEMWEIKPKGSKAK